MITAPSDGSSAQALAEGLKAYIERAAEAAGTTEALKPGHRRQFRWPPHPVSYSFHVLASDWTGTAQLVLHGETFDVQVARTPHGVFGRCEAIWHEDRGRTEEEMLRNLRKSAEPLFRRQLAMSSCLERLGRFTGHIRELPPEDLLKLLYCEDRDVANDARIEIETRASSTPLLPALLVVLNDRQHPNRRSAQWCVLDLFEDLPGFTRSDKDEDDAVEAMRGLVWDAEDDHARTIYKAGVVLGGHLPHKHGGPVLLECLNAPSRIGRRSAIHGLFHVVEWLPEMRGEVVARLRQVAERDPEPLLREYAAQMARDIESGDTEHVADPIFPGEG
jgi:hypothetical protein